MQETVLCNLASLDGRNILTNYVLENEMMHGTKERVGVVSLNKNNTQNYRKIQSIDIVNFTAKRKPLS